MVSKLSEDNRTLLEHVHCESMVARRTNSKKFSLQNQEQDPAIPQCCCGFVACEGDSEE